MSPITNESLSLLLNAQEPPCLSLYQPTHRHRPENQQDPIRFRNLVKSLEESLLQKYPTREVKSFLEPFQALAANTSFWNHTLDGLAVLSGPDVFQVYRLQRPTPELAMAADSFHIKPLVRIMQSADRYQVLALNRREIKLFEGNRDVLDEIELAPGVPRTITEALGEELTEPHQTVASYGQGAGGLPMRHGHGGKMDEIDTDTERFFRVIDRAIMAHHSKPSGLPLMLASLPEYHTPFRKLSHNPLLLAAGLEINPEALSLEELRQQAWQKMEPLYLARLADLVEIYQEARSRQKGADDLSDVAQAALSGRVATLLVEADRSLPGRIDPATGLVEAGDLSHPELDDMLDDLAEMVLRTKGEVVIVPADRMPSTTGLAAMYRF